jgi:hypothetical protein
MADAVSRPGGLAVRTRLLCVCGGWTTGYAQNDGSLWFAGRTAVDGPAVTVTCRQCDRPGTVDATELQHAVAERRRTFRIK